MPKVTIYTTPSCVYCKMAKSFFAANNIKYDEKDVMADEKAREDMFKKSEQMGVPVIDIGGKIVIGFSREILSELLGIK